MAQAVQSPARKVTQRKYHGCSSIHEYEIMDKLGEGTFGEVYKARSRRTSAIVALKKILMHNEKDGFPITALREIKLLKMLSHANVIKLDEMAIERIKHVEKKRAILYMVTPYMDHDLSGLLDNQDVRMTEPQIKCYMLQLLQGLKYLHNSQILHRDMKAANLLINNRGILQIADFGLARHYEDPPPQPGRGNGEARRDYTTLVVTRWYRPPELLLQLRRYTPAIDMWGAGCVFGEMFKRKPILAGSSDLNQAHIIFDLVGSPNNETMPGWDNLPGCDGIKSWSARSGNLANVFRDQNPQAISLLSELLKLDWRKRINAYDALEHPYFKTHPLPARPEDIPRFQDSHELDRRTARGQKAALPPAPAGGSVGMGPNGEWAGPGHPNSASRMNGDWYSRGSGWQQDRGPPGVGPSSRVPHASHDGRGPPPPPRRQPWQADSHRQPAHEPYGQRHHLPPPPPEGSRHPLPPPPHSHRPLPRKPDVDTYIPSYRDGPRDDRRPNDRDEYPPRNGAPPLRGGERNDRGRDYRERDRLGNDRRDYTRRTRSRSPGDRDHRDRARERDRDIYRR